MKNKIIYLVGIIIIITLGALNQKSDKLPSSFRTEFMVACVGKNESLYNYCDCTYDYLDDNYTNNQVIDMSMELYKENGMPDGMNKAIDACLSEINF